MQNPFKAGDAVITKVKGREVQASATKVWKNEVQVKTADGDLLWRTMYTVWRSGEAPLKREVAAKAAPTPVKSSAKNKASAAKKVAKKAGVQKAPASKSTRRNRK